MGVFSRTWALMEASWRNCLPEMNGFVTITNVGAVSLL
jgi:hypothetical protein